MTSKNPKGEETAPSPQDDDDFDLDEVIDRF
jgi:hypothetical protein